jgi:triosephosphate isomerase (TIM)
VLARVSKSAKQAITWLTPLEQLDAALQGIAANDVANLVIAYEPVWAIGTGEVATPADAQEVCGAIRARIREVHGTAADQTRVLYGGSMKADNVAALMLEADIDGGSSGRRLVGS